MSSLFLSWSQEPLKASKALFAARSLEIGAHSPGKMGLEE